MTNKIRMTNVECIIDRVITCHERPRSLEGVAKHSDRGPHSISIRPLNIGASVFVIRHSLIACRARQVAEMSPDVRTGDRCQRVASICAVSACRASIPPNRAARPLGGVLQCGGKRVSSRADGGSRSRVAANNHCISVVAVTAMVLRSMTAERNLATRSISSSSTTPATISS